MVVLQGSTINNLVSAFELYYRDESEAGADRQYTAHIRLVEGQDILEWEVRLNGIEVSEDGLEVMAQWKLKDMKNDGIFYTDSNCLEMQKRRLDWRPDFDLKTISKMSSNFYPIDSAIALRDVNSSLQMTVMNDRSQGGSSLEDGSVVLTHNRACVADDHKGLEEVLDERDRTSIAFDKFQSEMNKLRTPDMGIQVNAKYFI